MPLYTLLSVNARALTPDSAVAERPAPEQELFMSLNIADHTEQSFSRQERRVAEQESKRFSDPHRRRKFLSAVRGNATITRSAIATLEALMSHSDDAGKKVWPSQARLAHITSVSVRTVQRHLAELAQAGYLLIYSSPPKIDQRTGQYISRRTNRYYFSLKKQGTGTRKRRNPRSDLHAKEAPVTLIGIETSRSVGAGGFVSSFEYISHDRFKPRKPLETQMTGVREILNPAAVFAQQERQQATPTERASTLISSLRSKLR